MAETYMLLQTEAGRAGIVAKQVAALTGVLSAEQVPGPYDVMVRIAGGDLDDLAAGLVPIIRQVPGVSRILSLPAAGPTIDAR